MAKNHQADNPLFKALSKRYEAQIAEAYATLIVYFDEGGGRGDNPRGRGEIDKQLDVISTAEEGGEEGKKNGDNTQI